jgi:hypothetical protein
MQRKGSSLMIAHHGQYWFADTQGELSLGSLVLLYEGRAMEGPQQKAEKIE